MNYSPAAIELIPVLAQLSMIKILSITVLVHLAGAAIFFGYVSGLKSVIFSPVLSIFVWPYLFPEMLAVGLLWKIYGAEKDGFQRILEIGIPAMIIGGILMAVIGIKEVGSETRWTTAYLLSGAVAGAMATFLIHWLKPE